MPESTTPTHQTIDTNGWIEVRDNPLSKIGVFDYRGESLNQSGDFPDLDPDAFYPVLRAEEELANPETLNSARLLPWTDDHPEALLGKEEDGKVLPEEKGIGGVTGEDIYFKDGVLYGNIKFLTEALAEQYRKGKKELSMGYSCDFARESGVFEGTPYQFRQTHIRFNHLALVENGRMGKEVAVLDSTDKEMKQMSDEDRAKLIQQAIAALTALAESFQTGAAPAASAAPAESAPNPAEPAKDAAPAPAETLVDAAKSVIEAAQPAESADSEAPPPPAPTPDEKQGAADAEPAQGTQGAEQTQDAKDVGENAKPSGMDAAELIAHLAVRDRLAAALKPHIGIFDHAEMTIADVARYGNKKLGLNAAQGQEFAMLQGYLAAKRPKIPAQVAAMDAAPEKTYIDKYLEGGK